MKMKTSYHDTEVLQARIAQRLVAVLGEQTTMLPHDISERLRVAREQAVARAGAERRAAALAVPRSASAVIGGGVGVGRGGASMLSGPPPWWQRMAAVLPLLVLLVGLVFINERTAREQVLAAADIDAVLLADDLPPAAYTDPGFGEFLKTPLP